MAVPSGRRRNAGPLSGQSVLIIEDEAIIALDVHSVLREAGASLLAATSHEEALRMLPYAHVTAAVVDMRLGKSDCTAVCLELHRRSIPFLFYTASPRAEILRMWPTVPLVLKPEPPTHRLVCLLLGILRSPIKN
jgi:CheY-like chemotaxis protein